MSSVGILRALWRYLGSSPVASTKGSCKPVKSILGGGIVDRRQCVAAEVMRSESPGVC